ncbi:MAG: hypothetical protein ACYDIA_01865 [Candidatus Humimicrobiaceae bacterium]
MYEEPKYSRVKIKVLKAGKSTYWYAGLVGKIIEVEKQTFKDSVAYKSLEEEASYFFADDFKEVINE